MSIKNKKEVLKTIKTTKRIVNNKEYTYHEIYFGIDDKTGKKLRKATTDKNKIKQIVEDFYAMYQPYGSIEGYNGIDKELYLDAKRADVLLKDAECELSIYDVVKKYVLSEGGLCRCTLADAYQQYFNSIPEIQTAHRQCITTRVAPFINWVGRHYLCSAIQSSSMIEYLQLNAHWSDTTKNNVLSYVKSFFEWCCHPLRRYAKENPFKYIAPIKIKYTEPDYMIAEDVEKLFKAVEKTKDPYYILYCALSWFSGIRRAELERIQCKDINLEEEYIRISQPKGWTQGRPPRLVYLTPNASEWVKKYYQPREGLLLPHASTMYEKRLIRLSNKLNIEIPRNAGRHSFITHHVAWLQEPAKTEHLCGTSQTMRERNYQGLVSKKEGERYFLIVPYKEA